MIPVMSLAGGAAFSGTAMQEAAQVVVVYNSSVQAYAEALAGIRDGLGRAPGVVNLKNAGPAALEEALRSSSGKLIIAVGSEAVKSLANLKAPAPVVSTMVMHADGPSGAGGGLHSVAEIHLDVSVTSLLKELRRMYPAKNRLGIIRNPTRPEQEKGGLLAQARQQGFEAEVADCSGPSQLLAAFLSLKGRVDFVLCFADSSLYNSVTVEPLILASLEHRLPIIGFSESFVRAGAALGIFPDFQDIGRQTAEVTLRYIASQKDLSGEGPRKLKTVVNRRVLRLLGMQRPASVDYVVDR